ncbi:MAG TPA: hypothetical protein VN667_14665 [Burkholderiales bacterium]|nr:hypothetical protein [Burkholderiales bacterium]
MKFIAIGTHPAVPDGSTGGPTPEEIEQNRRYFQQGLDEGRFDCVYVMAGVGRMVIANAESEAALRASLAEPPDHPQRSWDVKQLLDFNQVIADFLKSVAAK